MDDERIARALREGPANEPTYQTGRFLRARDAGSTRERHLVRPRPPIAGALRVLAVGLAAVLVVVGLAVLRGNNPSQAPIPVGPSAVAPATAAPTPTPTPVATASPAPTASQTAAVLTGSATALALGKFHTCVLTRQGGVKCWGKNDSGQLGSDSGQRAEAPVDVLGLQSGVVAISAGDGHTCALTDQGAVKCWGDNIFGELGSGTTTLSTVPVDVQGLSSGVLAIAAGGHHTCAVLAQGGAVKCWGGYCGCETDVSVLGNGQTTVSPRPVAVTGLSGVLSIVAGSNHTCALNADGSVACWGENILGQLGTGTTANASTPGKVVGLPGRATSIAAAANQTCVIVGGSPMCWGSNSSGSLGDGSTATFSNVPVAVAGLVDPVATISPGTGFACVVTTVGGAWCWGQNLYGELGNGQRKVRVTPAVVPGLASGIQAIAAGDTHVCALTTGGAVECWGNNSDGQLGTGIARGVGSTTPAVVLGL